MAICYLHCRNWSIKNGHAFKVAVGNCISVYVSKF